MTLVDYCQSFLKERESKIYSLSSRYEPLTQNEENVARLALKLIDNVIASVDVREAAARCVEKQKTFDDSKNQLRQLLGADVDKVIAHEKNDSNS